MSTTRISREAFRAPLDNGLFLNGEIKTKDGGKDLPVVIAAHGFRGFKDWGFWPYVTDALAEQGFYTVIFDFSRIDAAAAKQPEAIVAQARTLSRELEDLQTILTLVREQRLPLSAAADPGRIGLLGHSRGGAASVITAAEQDAVGAVVAWNPPADLTPPTGVSAEPFIAADIEQHASRYDIPYQLAYLKRPALIVQGSADGERLLLGHEALRLAAPGHAFAQIEGGDHGFGIQHPFAGPTPFLDEALQATTRFFRHHLQPVEAVRKEAR
ncbi:alpha/beta hydrolase family protein [Paenibacillus methanolicus]|uniref:Dienelactone hydrolase family protein n=1 Tax=Paenibacillus methanolicus TaxID=582686 RepID=A0A5S5BVU8_9BACL|nr:dienelactone hydrolase family protein [Paenibacillus methanolicus]TYP69733.1 dienelactone hydrolase family protein [Paenibacillus methanolicus]